MPYDGAGFARAVDCLLALRGVVPADDEVGPEFDARPTHRDQSPVSQPEPVPPEGLCLVRVDYD